MTDGRNILVCGRTGTGKSYLLKQLTRDADRLIVYGPKREEHDWSGVYFDGMEPQGLKGFAWWFYHTVNTCRRFRIVYRPADLFDIHEFDVVANLVYACGNVVFVCEELMTYTTERNIEQGFKRLLVAGRTRGITCYMVTQRPFKIPREVTSQAREAYIFATHEPTDLDYCRQTFGIELILKLDQLKEYEHVHWIETGHVEIGKAIA